MAATAHDRPAAARRGALLLGAGTLPFAVGAAAYEPVAGDAGGPELVCPFRLVTGLPCPLCGSTRAVALAAHGDAAFLDFNAVAVVVLVAVALLGAAILLRGRPLRLRWSWAWLAIPAVAWAWTLAHRDTIVG